MLALGWDRACAAPFGFHRETDAQSDSIIHYDGDAPVCVIAPTGSGKGVSFLIPNLLTCHSPVIALDPKGELSAVCARARRAMGHRVVILDPFQVMGGTDRLNPFDLFELEGALLDADAEMLASHLSEGHSMAKDPFWTDTASGIISGLIAHIATTDNRSLTALREFLCDPELSYHLAVMLDTKKVSSQFARDEIAAYLQHSADKTRESVLSTAGTYLKCLGSGQVARSLEDSTFKLADIVSGQPIDVFIIVPPDKLQSHRALIRLWVGTLMTAIMRRKVIPPQKTLFVLDESAQLGTFEPLLTAATLLRGYGLQLITVWQDLAQMKSRYPQDWQTILNNSGAILAFGFGHYSAAKEYSEVLGIDPRELALLKPDEAVLAMRGEGTRKIGRLNYLTEGRYEELADPNPYFDRKLIMEPVQPKTWQEKVKSARSTILEVVEENRKTGCMDAEGERLFQAFLHMIEVVEELARLKEPKQSR